MPGDELRERLAISSIKLGSSSLKFLVHELADFWFWPEV